MDSINFITKFFFFLLVFISCPRFTEAQYSGTRGCKLQNDIVQVVQNKSNLNITRREDMEETDQFNLLLETGQLVEHNARECICGGSRKNTFCIITQSPGENYCYAKSSYNRRKDEVPLCYRHTFMHSFVQMFFAPICFAVLILFASVTTTRCGKHAKNYVLSRCFPGINRRIVDRILRREAMRREAFRRAIGMEIVEDVTAEAAAENQNGMQRKLSLHLKTKTFRPSSSSGDLAVATGEASVKDGCKDCSKDKCDESDSHAEDEEFCSICLVKLEPGDRIGALPCNHSFHVECLKTWVLWRNVCPLCNVPDIATTHVTMIPQDTNGN